MLLVVLVLGFQPLGTHQHQHAGTPEKLGTVHFVTACSATAQPTFDGAVALLHSFEFGLAIDAFTTTLQRDPSCAMAEWGIALSRWMNPLGRSGGRPPSC